MRYQSPSQIGTWNGWTEPTLPPPSFEEKYHNLADAIDRELAEVPIEQQTVIVAALWDIDSWGVDVLMAPPTGNRYDGWAECLVDFNQYNGTIKEIRQDTAAALAYDLMNQTFPGWRDPNYGQPEPDWEDWN